MKIDLPGYGTRTEPDFPSVGACVICGEQLIRGSSALAALNEWVRRLNAAWCPWSLVEVGIGSGAGFEAFQRRTK